MNHPGDLLEAQLLAAFPAATLVDVDEGEPWSTVHRGPRGALQSRHAPLEDDPTGDAP